MTKRLSPYIPVLVLFALAVVVALCTYQQYGMSWDEQLQRAPGVLSYNYIFNGSDALFTTESDNHGAAFELFLVMVEKSLGLSLPADIYHMRHLVSHLVFLLGALSVAVLALRTTGSRTLSCMAFLAMVCMPRIYAHSFFNSKDVPFLAFIAMSLLAAQVAFARQRAVYFVLLGLLLGYATGIRIMGLSVFCMVLAFLLLDAFYALRSRQAAWGPLRHLLLLSVCFCFAVYISWPYLWRSPVSTFIESFRLMTKYSWGAKVLFMGEYIDSNHLPWTYFPVWFGITTPLLWLAAGCAGMLMVMVGMVRTPLRYLHNTPERGQLLLLGSFVGPVLSVILLHSVIYDDWRHLYFVYPPFVLLGICFLHTVYKGRYRQLIMAACAVQVAVVGGFMMQHLNFMQVYFNPLVSHENEYLRHNYELDYWGAGFRKGMQYLADKKPDSVAAISSGGMSLLLENNILLLPPADAARLKIVGDRDSCNYFITNFRLHRDDYTQYPTTEYSIKVENSTVLRIYKVSGARY